MPSGIIFMHDYRICIKIEKCPQLNREIVFADFKDDTP